LKDMQRKTSMHSLVANSLLLLQTTLTNKTIRSPIILSQRVRLFATL